MTADLAKTIPELLQQAVERHGDRVAWTTHGTTGDHAEPALTFREVDSLVAARRRRLPAGEGPIAILLDNSPDWAVSFLAVAGTARPAVLLDAARTAEEISRQLRHAEVRTVITDARRAAQLREAWSEAREGRVRWLMVDGDEPWPTRAGACRAPVASDLAAILYTSGPTLKPRGVEQTQASLVNSALRSAERLDATPNDVTLALLPFAHVLGLVTLLLTPIAAGAKVVYLRSPRPVAMLDAIRDGGVTTLVATPALYQFLVRRLRDRLATRPALERAIARGALFLIPAFARFAPTLGAAIARRIVRPVRDCFGSRLDKLVSGGAKLGASTARLLRGMGFDLREGYGLTESAGPICVGPRFTARPGSMGTAYRGMEIKIRNPNASGVGEICARGDQIMRGYHKEPERTGEVLVDGWLRTGDLGRLATDGSLEFHGRLKDVIVTTAGKKIHPEDIEAHFSTVPGVATLRVFGLPDDAEQMLVLAARPTEEVQQNDADLTAFRRSLERRNVELAPHERVRQFFIEVGDAGGERGADPETADRVRL